MPYQTSGASTVSAAHPASTTSARRHSDRCSRRRRASTTAATTAAAKIAVTSVCTQSPSSTPTTPIDTSRRRADPVHGHATRPIVHAAARTATVMLRLYSTPE